MEILILVLLYYFSQNPDFAESVKPIMSKIKDSEQMLGFLNDLSKFSQTFGSFSKKKEENKEKPPEEKPEQEKAENKKSPQSPTEGIADEFIQNILEGYLKKQ